METEIDAHTLLNFLLHREMRRTLQIDVHLKASTEQMRGDTDFRLCKYTCTELPPVLPCYHFAASYSFPEKKSVPELNDQPTYMKCFKVFYPMTGSFLQLYCNFILRKNGWMYHWLRAVFRQILRTLSSCCVSTSQLLLRYSSTGLVNIKLFLCLCVMSWACVLGITANNLSWPWH